MPFLVAKKYVFIQITFAFPEKIVLFYGIHQKPVLQQFKTNNIMGLINDFKKLFFGAEAVGKSAARKASEKGKETSEHWRKKSEEFSEKAKETAEDIGEDLHEQSERAKDFAEEVGEDILEKADKFWKKTQDVAEDIGEEVIKRSKPYMDKAKRFAEEREQAFQQRQESKTRQQPPKDTTDKTSEEDEDLASSIIDDAFEEKDEIVKEAEKQVENTEDEMDNILDEASKLSADLEEKTASSEDSSFEEGENEGSPEVGYDKLKGSLLDGQDDFFAKAQRYADGDYFDEKSSLSDEEEDEMKITKDPDYKKEESEGTVYGFEDMDGDGDEIIDDAIIVEDEEDDKTGK